MKKEKIKTKKKAEGIEFPNSKRTSQPDKKSRKEIRKQKNRSKFVTFVLVMILLSICVFISLKVLFIVQKVEVVGTERYTAQEIIDFCAVPMEENIFTVEVGTMPQAILNNFTYIDSVTVERKLPNKILIDVEDAIPTYCVKTENENGEDIYTVYSQRFKQLTTQSQRPEGLVHIDMDMNDEESMELFDSFIKTTEANGYTGYTEICVKPTGEVGFVYADRLNVNLGTKLDLEYKLRMVYHVINEEISPDAKGKIDASVSGKIVYNLGA